MLEYEVSLHKMAVELAERYYDNLMGGSMNPWSGVNTFDVAKTLSVVYDKPNSDVEKVLSTLVNFYINK